MTKCHNVKLATQASIVTSFADLFKFLLQKTLLTRQLNINNRLTSLFLTTLVDSEAGDFIVLAVEVVGDVVVDVPDETNSNSEDSLEAFEPEIIAKTGNEKMTF